MQSVMDSVLFYCRTGDVRTPLSPFFRYPHPPGRSINTRYRAHSSHLAGQGTMQVISHTLPVDPWAALSRSIVSDMARLIKPVVLSPWASAWAWTALRRSGVILTLTSTNFSIYFLFALFCASVVRGFSSLTFLPPFRGNPQFWGHLSQHASIIAQKAISDQI